MQSLKGNPDVINTILNYPAWALVIQVLNLSYTEKKFVQYHEFFKSFKNRDVPCTITLQVFVKELNTLGISFHQLPTGQTLLLEDPNIRYERALYLEKLKGAREHRNKTIYYVDIRTIDLSCSFPMTAITEELEDVSITFAFLHLISPHGYINGLFCNGPVQQNFNNWMINIVTQKINPNSVVIVHTNFIDYKVPKKITILHPKQDMLNWLKENNIPHNSNMSKVQLYELIRKCPEKNPVNKICSIFNAHGHEILCLPKSFQVCSPTELLWNMFRSKFETNSFKDIYEIKNEILNTLKGEECEWQAWYELVQNSENIAYKLDIETDEALDKYMLGSKS